MIIVPGGSIDLDGTGADNYVATFTGPTTIGGEANLTFDGNTLTVIGAVNVGVDDTGHDVKFFGATSGKYMLWDEDQDELIISGGVGIGETAPANLLHVKVSDTGITPHGSAQIVLERDGTNYLQFLTGNDGTSGLLFGDEDDIDVAKIYYDHNVPAMYFATEANIGMTLAGGGTPVLKLFGTASTGTDAGIVFDGEAVDYHIGLDDSADALTIGSGTTLAAGGANSRLDFFKTGTHYYGVAMKGSHTSDGESTIVSGFAVGPDVTAVDGDETWVALMSIGGSSSGGSITTQGTSDTYTQVITSLYVDEPNITDSGDTIPYASTVFIENAPSEGETANYALWVDAGMSRFDGIVETFGSRLRISDGGQLQIENGDEDYIWANYVDGSDNLVWQNNAGVDTFFISSTGDVTMKGTTPSLTIGDAGTEDTSIVYKGNAQDFYLGLDDGGDALFIGTDATVGSNGAIIIDKKGGVGSNVPHVGINATPNINDLVTIGGAFAGYSNTFGLRVEPTLTAKADQNASVISVAGTLVEASSGTHGLLFGTSFSAPSITNHVSAAVENTATVYISGAPSATVTGKNHALWVDAGISRFDGAISLTTDHGDDGQQLTSGGDDAACDWTAASSLRKYKNIGRQASPQEALETMLNTPAYHFHYKEKKGTGDTSTEYVGVMADEASWAMHYKGTIVNPVNTLGYTVLSVQALNNKIEKLEQELELLRS